MRIEERESEHPVLRLGGVLGVLGGMGFFAILLVHGDLPDQTTELALEHIAGRPEWAAMKLLLIVFSFLWLGTFLTLAETWKEGIPRLVGRMALVCLILGAAIMAVQYSITGYGLKNTADAWAAASGPEAEAALHQGSALLAATGGMFSSFIAWLFGLPFVLMGYALLRSREYPSWLAWWAMVAGTGALVAGTTRFLGLEVVPFPLLYGGFVVPLCFWLAMVGVVMWRRASSLQSQH